MEANFWTIGIAVCLVISIALNVALALFLFFETRPIDGGAGFADLMRKIEEDEERRGYYGGRVQLGKIYGGDKVCWQYNGGYVKPGVWGMCETCGGTIEQHEGAKEAAYEERLRDFKSMGIEDFIKKHGGEG